MTVFDEAAVYYINVAIKKRSNYYDKKRGDIIEFVTRIEILLPEGSESLSEIAVDEYKRECYVEVTVNETETVQEYSVTVDEGFSSPYEDIKYLIEQEMADSFKEVTEYEIVDLYDKEYDFQSAKVRVKAVK